MGNSTKTTQPITLPSWKVERIFAGPHERIDWGLTMFSVQDFWRYTKGKDIKVAVLDSGIDLFHPDLKDAILDKCDFTDSDSGPYDVRGHGTHICGIIAARENNYGIIGVAPSCQLLVGKIINDSGYVHPDTVVKGIHWAIKKKADVISLSIIFQYPDEDIHQAILDAIDAGIFVICAVGNKGPHPGTVTYPAAYPETLAVGSINKNYRVSSFSSAGWEVDIVAPGEKILSTFPPKRLAEMSGSSMAAPFVVGVTALMLAKHRQYGGNTSIKTQKELKEHLQKTAINILADGKEDPQTGVDPYYGHGLINPKKLLS